MPSPDLDDFTSTGIPVGKTESQVAPDPLGPLTFYGDRPSFDAAHPGLPVEDWEDFLVGAGGVWAAPRPPTAPPAALAATTLALSSPVSSCSTTSVRIRMDWSSSAAASTATRRFSSAPTPSSTRWSSTSTRRSGRSAWTSPATSTPTTSRSTFLMPAPASLAARTLLAPTRVRSSVSSSTGRYRLDPDQSATDQAEIIDDVCLRRPRGPGDAAVDRRRVVLRRSSSSVRTPGLRPGRFSNGNARGRMGRWCRAVQLPLLTRGTNPAMGAPESMGLPRRRGPARRPAG